MQNDFRQQILETQLELGINPSAIEKDIYITRTLHALCDCENEYLKLIFQGGTCLAKAHKIIRRMSEDCDFRIIPLANSKNLSKQALRNRISAFRNKLLDELKNASFEIKPEHIMVANLGQFMRIELYYESIFSQRNSILRPHILLEFIFTDIRLKPQLLPVTTLIKDTLGDVIDHSIKSIYCVSIEETLAEKWVALLRRISNIEHGEMHDNTLIRHLYDINQLSAHTVIDHNFIRITNSIISDERGRYKNKNITYHQKTINEIKNSIHLLELQPKWKNDWDNLSEFMVFKSERVDFKTAINNLRNLSELLLNDIDFMSA